MVVNQYINHFIPALKPSDTVEKALNWMEDNKIAHLPVVQEGQLQGLVGELALLACEDWTVSVDNFVSSKEMQTCAAEQHVFESISALIDTDQTVIPVLDQTKKYVGCVTALDLMKAFSEYGGLANQGGILVLSLSANDFSLAEIARIVESNGAKIISSLGHFLKEDPNIMHVTLKLNVTQLDRIKAGLERHQYNIIASFGEYFAENQDEERLDQFFKFLNI